MAVGGGVSSGVSGAGGAPPLMPPVESEAELEAQMERACVEMERLSERLATRDPQDSDQVRLYGVSTASLR